MKKNILITFLALFLIWGCKTDSKNQTNMNNNDARVQEDRDTGVSSRQRRKSNAGLTVVCKLDLLFRALIKFRKLIKL